MSLAQKDIIRRMAWKYKKEEARPKLEKKGPEGETWRQGREAWPGSVTSEGAKRGESNG